MILFFTSSNEKLYSLKLKSPLNVSVVTKKSKSICDRSPRFHSEWYWDERSDRPNCIRCCSSHSLFYSRDMMIPAAEQTAFTLTSSLYRVTHTPPSIWLNDRKTSNKIHFSKQGLLFFHDLAFPTLGKKILVCPRIHILKTSFLTKFTFWKSPFLAKFTISKPHFSDFS